MRTPLWPISSVALSMVGSATPHTRLAGPPACTMASFISCTAWLELPLAPGWALNTTELPAATMEIVLQITVEVGLVLGMIEPITP
jgi:hypothetical protein